MVKKSNGWVNINQIYGEKWNLVLSTFSLECLDFFQ